MENKLNPIEIFEESIFQFKTINLKYHLTFEKKQTGINI